MYYALIGDIIDSRKLENRDGVQKDLHDILDVLNDRFDDHLASRLTLTLGDEFQGVFFDIESVFLVIDLLDTYCAYALSSKLKLRYGIGIGTVSTEIRKEISIGADGPAYWNARDAITIVHKYNDSMNTNTWICGDGLTYETENAVIRLLDAIRNNWTLSQSTFMHQVLSLFGYEEIVPGGIVADSGLSSQQVANRLKTTYARQYLSARRRLVCMMEEANV